LRVKCMAGSKCRSLNNCKISRRKQRPSRAVSSDRSGDFSADDKFHLAAAFAHFHEASASSPRFGIISRLRIQDWDLGFGICFLSLWRERA